MPYTVGDKIFCGLCSRGFDSYEQLHIHYLQHDLGHLKDKQKEIGEIIEKLSNDIDKIVNKQENQVIKEEKIEEIDHINCIHDCGGKMISDGTYYHCNKCGSYSDVD